MSVKAAIDLAIHLELVRILEAKVPGVAAAAAQQPNAPANAAAAATERYRARASEYWRIMEGTADTGYELSLAELANLLLGVARRLKVDEPRASFAWTKTDTAKCKDADRDRLIELIAADTELDVGAG